MDKITFAIARTPADTMGRGITEARLGPPDYELALEQHARYVRALESLGVEVLTLPPAPEYPDAHFVEDTAVIVPGGAVITRPGAESRRGEERSIEPALAPRMPVQRIEAPGTLDGGDVLAAGGVFFVGISRRTNENGARQLGSALERAGVEWRPVPVEAGLHLKSSASYLGGNTLLVNDSTAEAAEFEGFDRIIVTETEQGAASILAINDRLLIPSGYPQTRAELEGRGFETMELDISEMQKMDGGLTCLSIRI
jgi:dimethylargininase